MHLNTLHPTVMETNIEDILPIFSPKVDLTSLLLLISVQLMQPFQTEEVKMGTSNVAKVRKTL